MWRRRKDNLKRRMMSGILACLLVATSLTNTVGIITSFAGQTANIPRVSYKYDDLKNDKGQLDKMVQINVQAENESFAPGSEMVLKVYVQNLSDQNLTGGSLKWSGKGLEEAGFLDEEEEDLFNGPGWDGEDNDSDTSDLMEELGNFSVTGLRKSVALKVDDTAAKDETEAPEQNVEIITDVETEEEEDDTSDPQTDEEGKRIRGIELAPGEVYETRFYGTVEDMDSIVTRKVTFEFLAGTDDNKVAQDKAEFTYNTGMALVLPIEFDDGPALMTNELNTMYIHTRFEDEKILDEYTWDITDEDEATPSDAERHEITVATMSNGTEDSSEGTTPANMKYSIVTYGAKLEGIEAWYDDERSGWGEMTTGVSFRVKDDTEPGVYFGQVTTSIRREGKSYKTTQGFHFFVLGDGQLVLKGNINGAEIQVKGDRSSFPEGDMLSLKVTEVPAEKMDLVQEAMVQKAEELGVSVDKMKAMDIKVIADGVEQELEGEVEVTFSNLTLEKVEETIGLEDEENIEDGEVEELEEINTNAVFGLRKASAGTEEDQADAAGEGEIAEAENESEGEEKEEATLAVWHLDEDAGLMDEMNSKINNDGALVMETNHFSIFIIVNVANGQRTVPVTIKHFARVKKMEIVNGDPYKDGYEYKGTGTWYIKTGIPKRLSEPGADKGTGSILYPGAKDTNGNYDTELVEIYEPDTLQLPNGGGTGIGYSILIEELSKLARGGNYTISKITIKNAKYSPEYPDGKEIINGTEKEEIYLDSGENEIIIEYVPTTSRKRGEVEFHDYNVSVAGADGSIHTVNTQNKGINDPELTKGTDRIGIGIYNRTDSGVWHDYNYKQNAAAYDLPNRLRAMYIHDMPRENLTDNSMIQFNGYEDPGLFCQKDVVLEDGQIAKKYITDYELEFFREGDTYTLDAVYKKGTNDGISNLRTLRHTTEAYAKPYHLYTNLFWPLDDEKLVYKGKDPLFPGSTGFSKNDENVWGGDYSSINHNWFFGMRYDFEFTLGDYIGPLDYYFRGDDDFWLFIDGKLVKDVDLGGIHSATGAYVDLKEWLSKNNIDMTDKNRPHKMTVYFMERGGTGSCCYMQFTLPNIVSVPVKDSGLITKTVTKEWQDGNNEHGTRPQEIYVQLLQNNEPFGSRQKLDESNNWSFTWVNLPQYRYVDSDEENIYTVEEIKVPGYESVIDQDTFTITNIETTYLKVEKYWDDEDDRYETRPPEIQVQLYKKVGNGSWQKDGEAITLTSDSDSSKDWKYGWQDKPLYEKVGSSYQKVEYKVEEVAADWLVSKDNQGGWYVGEVTGDQNNGFTITNSYKPTYVSKEVEKRWDDDNNKFGLRPATIDVELYQGNIKYSSITLPKTDSEGNIISWRHKWVDLPQYYYTKGNDGVVTQTAYEYTVREVISSNGEYYTTAYSPEDTKAKNVIITNTLQTAKFRVAKRIDNINIELDTSDLLDDEFIINVSKADGQSGIPFETGLVLQHAGDTDEKVGNNEKQRVSGYIEVPVTDEGVRYNITEIVPKEYQLNEEYTVSENGKTYLTIINNVIRNDGKTEKVASIVNRSQVLIKAGSEDTIVIVHNKFSHSDYFHSKASITNLFKSGGTLPVDEIARLIVPMGAFMAEESDKEWERKYHDEERLM